MGGSSKDVATDGDDDDDQDQESPLPLHAVLQNISLPATNALRELLNAVAVDAGLYMQDKGRERMCKHVASAIRTVVHKFRLAHPNFSGKISLLGHSLGSVICFDLLTKAPTTTGSGSSGGGSSSSSSGGSSIPRTGLLGFTPCALFAIGSPLALFLALRGVQPSELLELLGTLRTGKVGTTATDDGRGKGMCSEDDKEMLALSKATVATTTTDFFNIFNLCDPVAQRLEPLASPAATSVHPVKILSKRSALGQQNNPPPAGHGGFGAMGPTGPAPVAAGTDGGEREKGVAKAEMQAAAVVQLLRKIDARLDYELPHAYTVSEYMAAMTAHSSYWKNPELFRFIVANLRGGRGEEQEKQGLQGEEGATI
jgi:hypothetical protein